MTKGSLHSSLVLVWGLLFAAACSDDASSLSNANELASYSFQKAQNPNLGADVIATINGSAIAATVPFGINVTALIATYATTGISVGAGVSVTPQVSGTTPNDFTNSVGYTVTAADGDKRVYAVTVIVARSSTKEITAYMFEAAHNAGLSADVPATINGTAIAATVPAGTDVAALVATFSKTGVTAKVGNTAQTSGVTSNNFHDPVTYTVLAADETSKEFTATVTIAP